MAGIKPNPGPEKAPSTTTFQRKTLPAFNSFLKQELRRDFTSRKAQIMELDVNKLPEWENPNFGRACRALKKGVNYLEEKTFGILGGSVCFRV